MTTTLRDLLLALETPPPAMSESWFAQICSQHTEASRSPQPAGQPSERDVWDVVRVGTVGQLIGLEELTVRELQQFAAELDGWLRAPSGAGSSSSERADDSTQLSESGDSQAYRVQSREYTNEHKQLIVGQRLGNSDTFSSVGLAKSASRRVTGGRKGKRKPPRASSRGSSGSAARSPGVRPTGATVRGHARQLAVLGAAACLLAAVLALLLRPRQASESASPSLASDTVREVPQSRSTTAGTQRAAEDEPEPLLVQSSDGSAPVVPLTSEDGLYPLRARTAASALERLTTLNGADFKRDASNAVDEQDKSPSGGVAQDTVPGAGLLPQASLAEIGSLAAVNSSAGSTAESVMQQVQATLTAAEAQSQAQVQATATAADVAGGRPESAAENDTGVPQDSVAVADAESKQDVPLPSPDTPSAAIPFSLDSVIHQVAYPRGLRPKPRDPNWELQIEVAEGFNVEPSEPQTLGTKEHVSWVIVDSSSRSPRACVVVHASQLPVRDGGIRLRIGGGSEDLPALLLPLNREWLDPLSSAIRSYSARLQIANSNSPDSLAWVPGRTAAEKRRWLTAQLKLSQRVLEVSADVDRLRSLLDEEITLHAKLFDSQSKKLLLQFGSLPLR